MPQKPETRLRELLNELHYWQEQARIERRWLRASAENAKAIAAQMREIQKEMHAPKPAPAKKPPRRARALVQGSLFSEGKR